MNSFSFKPTFPCYGNQTATRLTTVPICMCTISILTGYTSCMDNLISPQKIKFENVYLKFETNIKHLTHTYGIEIFIPYNYIMFISYMVLNYHSYLQTAPFEQKIVVSLRRNDGIIVKKYFKDLLGEWPDMVLLQTIKNDCEYLATVLLQHIDDYLVLHINLDENLKDIRPRFESIEGIWKKEFSWAMRNLEEVTFSGIYQTNAYKYLDDITTGIIVLVSFDQKNEIVKVGGETEFQIIYNLLEAMHKDLFKNKKLSHYHFIVERIVQQNFESHIYIHKKCIDILRLFDNEQKDQSIMAISMIPVDILLPYMCYFNLLGAVLSRFRDSLFIENLEHSVKKLSLLVGEYLIITSQHNKKGDLFVRIRKSFIKPVIKNFLHDGWKDINTCKVVEVEKFMELDSEIIDDVNHKIYKILIEAFDFIVTSTDHIEEILGKCFEEKQQ